MYVKHDYKCLSCETYHPDKFVKRAEMEEQACPDCGGTMRILPCMPRVDWSRLAMGENASPEAIRRFERAHKQQAEKEKKSMAEHGDRGRTPGS